MYDRFNFADTVFRSRFSFADNTFWQKKREAKSFSLGYCLRLQLYRLFDGNDQATVRCLSADQGYELVVAVTEGQTIYSFLPVYVDQDLVFNLFNERALDV